VTNLLNKSDIPSLLCIIYLQKDFYTSKDKKYFPKQKKGGASATHKKE